MRSYQDVIVFHKDGQFYGYITYGDFLKDKNRYELYMSSNQLEAKVLNFAVTELDLSPLGKRIWKAIDFYLFKIDTSLESYVRTKLLKLIAWDYKKLIQIISLLANQIAEIYQRAYNISMNEDLIDIKKCKTIIYTNIVSILNEIEGD